MRALKPSPSAVLSPSSSPPAPFRTVRSNSCDALGPLARGSAPRLNMSCEQPRRYASPGSRDLTQPARRVVLESWLAKPSKYSKTRTFSNTTRVPHIRRGRKAAGFRTTATQLRPRRADWACPARGRATCYNCHTPLGQPISTPLGRSTASQGPPRHVPKASGTHRQQTRMISREEHLW